MKATEVTPKKNKAQAMVEFAIALPILLMLLYGILEAGRLLFIYSTVVTASRQAVRYGSATGLGNAGVPRYQDCAGIRASANRADFLNSFDDSDVHIFYDEGPNSSPPPDGLNETEFCDGVNPPPTSSILADNSHRLVVRIYGDFFPIVPKLVPFIERSTARGNPIEGISARTILLSISIAVTNTPDLSTPTPSATATPTSTASPTNTATPTPTNTLEFTYTPTLTATITLSPTATLSPTPSRTPTITNTPTRTPSPTLSPTPVANCGLITHGPITNSGNSMTMSINSPVTAPVQIQDVFVVWNHDGGHQTTGDKTLQLISVSLGGVFWTGNSFGPSQSIVPSPTKYIPTGTSVITFTFHQSYDNWDGTEEILINLATSGCTTSPIHAP